MVPYLVTFRIDNGPRKGKNTTVPVFADSEHDAAEYIKGKLPKAIVLATTHPDA